MYLALMSVCLCATYLIVYFLAPWIFKQPLPRFGRANVISIAFILIASLIAFGISGLPHDPWWQNRLLHGLGGGSLAFLVCFLAFRDNALPLNRLQFFILGFLIVTALGVANELAEFFGQKYLALSFARTIEDTWLDLASNTIGAVLLGTVLSVLFRSIPKK